MIGEPCLGNREATTLPEPWVKWSYEPARAEDVPGAFMRAYAMAVQPLAGPVYLSIPLDDWKRPLSGFTRIRTVSDRVVPDTQRLQTFADRISAGRRPALVFGPEADRSDGWDQAVALAEKLRAAVYGAPLLDRASFRGLCGPEQRQAGRRGHRQRIDLHHGPADGVVSTTRTGSFFATAGGGIGWGTPAAVGVALADRHRGVNRPVVGLIGDGSFQYSVQSIWTAAQHRLPLVYVVMRNEEYSILKSFAVLEETPGVPGLDLPGLDIASWAHGFGRHAVDVDTTEDLQREFKAALAADTTTVIVVRTQPQKAML